MFERFVCARQELKPRYLYFSLFIVLASVGRFTSLILHDSLALQDSEVGVVLGLGIVSGMLCVQFWTRRSDGPRGCLNVLLELTILHALTYSFLIIAVFVEDVNIRFWIVAISRFLSAGFIAPMGSITDAYNLRSIADPDLYGKERLWGAISWALTSILMGVCMDVTNSPLAISLIFLGVSSLMFLIVLQIMPDERAKDSSDTSQRKIVSRPLWRIWIGQVRTSTFLFISLVMGAATSLVENLLFLFMRGDLKASYTICGISVLITVLFEIPLFFGGKSLLASVGTLRLILGGMFCYVIRVVIYTLVSNPWTVLLVEPLHGLTYAMIQTSLVSFVHARCTKDRIAEGQGLLQFFRSFGTFLGTVIGGKVLEVFGSSVMYRTSAIIVTISAVILVIVFHFSPQYEIFNGDGNSVQDVELGLTSKSNSLNQLGGGEENGSVAVAETENPKRKTVNGNEFQAIPSVNSNEINNSSV